MNDCDINDSRGNRDKTSERRTNFANCDSSSKRLKFGIDEILSSESSRTVGRQDDKYQDSGGTRYYDGPQCCQFNHVISSSYGHFCSPFYISASSFLPVVRKYANFVIEGDRNNADGATSKRKRIWSRAVFSKLQRKGLEKRFQVQKYIMKPDRKQLAATLGLTDAQVKVWFQNRRMKWRNSRENSDKPEPEQTSK